MADTDDEQSVGLDPAYAKGEDEGAPGAEAAGEDRRAKEWEAGADLAQAEGAGLDEEADEDEARRHREDAEQDARDERERLDSRRRLDVNRAEAEVAEALRLAHVDERGRDNFRSHADSERRLARQDFGRAAGLESGAAGRDDPAAEADRAEAGRARVSGSIENARANRDDATADTYSADAREHRREADVRRLEQPPAAEAVRNPPQRTPRARKNLRSRKPKTKELRDFGLGE
ncbi:hypothetical protein EV138_3557 [Kribbella voronezhensis]|uniref:Uncharacterized protein n=1 Tax=Kribbella voronezhensis TaxID=2512212 RepID=A0A4R7TEM8_9ACTN|nr:hypothetical protein [Kribbella voronezhensis]TDU89976.1 hypothetical protein EV138_3557 [Kribbella voronezhensis]